MVMNNKSLVGTNNDGSESNGMNEIAKVQNRLVLTKTKDL